MLLIIDNNISSLGIDQMFAIIDFHKKIIKVILKLDYYLYDIRSIDREIWGITQLEILRFDEINYNILQIIGLPSFFEDLILLGSLVIVNCLEGEIIQIDIS